jgi:hypothetical protein
MSRLLFLLLVFPLEIWGQMSSEDTLTNDLQFLSIEQILEHSKKISSETFELKFLVRSLPDNGWFLKLNKDSTYEYIYWSGFGEPEGTILEKGNYSIKNNRLKLVADKKKSQLKNSKFYLVTAATDAIDNNCTIDCVKDGKVTYCLYHR